MAPSPRWLGILLVFAVATAPLPACGAQPGTQPGPAVQVSAPGAGKGPVAVPAPARVALTKKASTGDPAAQYALGLALVQGDFGAPDPADALAWLQASAKQGFAPAMTQLGRLHRDGLGTRADPFQAVRWFRAAAGTGFRPAQIELALMVAEGKGSHQDLVEAWALLESASATLALAPAGEYASAARVLADLSRRLSPEQQGLARKRLVELKDEDLAAMMRRYPGASPKGKPASPVGAQPPTRAP